MFALLEIASVHRVQKQHPTSVKAYWMLFFLITLAVSFFGRSAVMVMVA